MSHPPSRQLEVLESEHLLGLVFSYLEYSTLSDDGDLEIDRSGRKALRFACLTCRAFFKPATDLLWRHMESFTPLLKVLPTFVDDDGIYIVHKIQPVHIERFETYARKIQTLSIKSWPDVIEFPCIYFVSRNLKMLTDDNLPALVTIHVSAVFDTCHVANFDPLFLAYGSLLTNLTIKDINSENEPLFLLFLIHLSVKAPNIQYLRLSGDLLTPVLACLKDFKKLRNLYIEDQTAYPDPDPSITTTTVLQDRGAIKGFPALESLNISGTFRDTAKILGSLFHAPELCDIPYRRTIEIELEEIQCVLALH